MTAKSSRHLASRLTKASAPTAAVLALVAGLAGCKGVVVASSTAGSSPSAAAASTAAALSVAATPTSALTSAPASAAAADQATTTPAQGPGSVSVSVTSPVSVSGSVAVPVSCVTGLAYRATVSSAVVQGDQLSFSVAIPRYRGAGSYPTAVVGVTLHQASGVVTTIAGVSRVPAVISSTGGSFSVSATGSGGRTFTGSLTWACGS
jgi:hypothetical protein